MTNVKHGATPGTATSKKSSTTNEQCKTLQACKPASIIPSFDSLPDSALIRESCLVQSPKRPARPAPLPFSAATLWRLVSTGKFPPPVKLSQRITAWKVSEVRAWIKAKEIAQ